MCPLASHLPPPLSSPHSSIFTSLLYLHLTPLSSPHSSIFTSLLTFLLLYLHLTPHLPSPLSSPHSSPSFSSIFTSLLTFLLLYLHLTPHLPSPLSSPHSSLFLKLPSPFSLLPPLVLPHSPPPHTAHVTPLHCLTPLTSYTRTHTHTHTRTHTHTHTHAARTGNLNTNEPDPLHSRVPHLSNLHSPHDRNHGCLHPKNCWHCCCYRPTLCTGNWLVS